MTYAPIAPHPMTPVLLELPEEATPEGALVTATYLNGGLSAADAARLTVPMPVQSGDPAVRARINAGLQIGFIVLAITAGGLLAASEDVPRPAEGSPSWAEVAAVVTFLVAMTLGSLPKLLGRKHKNALRAWVAGVGEAYHLRVMLVPVKAIEGDGHRAEILELAESLAQSRDAIMHARRGACVSHPGEGELLAALGSLARYAHHPAPFEQTRAREAVFTFAEHADNYVHTGNPDTPLGDARV